MPPVFIDYEKPGPRRRTKAIVAAALAASAGLAGAAACVVRIARVIAEYRANPDPVDYIDLSPGLSIGQAAPLAVICVGFAIVALVVLVRLWNSTRLDADPE